MMDPLFGQHEQRAAESRDTWSKYFIFYYLGFFPGYQFKGLFKCSSLKQSCGYDHIY